LEREILDGDEIDKIIRGETLPPLERKNGNGQPVSAPQVNTPVAEPTPSGRPSNGAQGEDKTSKARQRSKK